MMDGTPVDPLDDALTFRARENGSALPHSGSRHDVTRKFLGEVVRGGAETHRCGALPRRAHVPSSEVSTADCRLPICCLPCGASQSSS